MERVAFVHVVHGISRLGSASSSFVRRLPTKPHLLPGRRASVLACVTRNDKRSTAKSTAKSKDDVNPYSTTVNLPKTTFEQRANATKREPQLQQYWLENRVYEKLSRENSGDTFVLHDGPPFANGPLHCGHALNKILKDFINKHALMCGKRAVFIPGWDTHGLPIELKVLQSTKGKDRKSLSALELRKRARHFAEETVSNHIVGMRRFGVWADWEAPYLTMHPEYEAAQMEVFGRMFERGYIFRGRKPVHWSPSSRTALAEAELEYPDGHTSRSCYCAFVVDSLPDDAPELLIQAGALTDGLALSIWTTTPWTLPANRAVAVNSKLEYAVVRGLHPTRRNAAVLIARALLSSTAEKFGTSDQIELLGSLSGSDLIGIRYSHPLQTGLVCPVVEGGDYISTDTGTGLVHTAPGHGQEDYQTGLREKLDVFSPVDDAGRFTNEAADGQFVGMSVLTDGTAAVLETIGKSDVLMLEEKYSHKYPYDWRTKKPTIFRATEQWFVSVAEFRDDVLRAIDNVRFVPESGERRIKGMVEGRGDWCISRQRSWGVPIPVFYDTSGEAIMSPDVVENVTKIVRKRGTDSWWELDAEELLPENYRGRGLRKGMDTMDVWFDSGSSWAAVAKQRKELAYPADIYLEGSDQHRGWFQSSILTSMATEKRAPYKQVLTHGFVLDEKGIKMSKSIGNVVDPLAVINGGNNKKVEPAYGADVLRLWVCSVDYSGDIMIGPSILKQISDVYKKLRNTMRYMVGNIHDFDPAKHAVPFSELPSLDKYMLARTMVVCDEIDAAYNNYSYFKVYQALQRFAVVELSNFYLDIAKDRLYIPATDSFRRRSCQTVIAAVLENYTRAIAPVLPHTAEDLWQSLPYNPQSGNKNFVNAESIFQCGWFERRPEWLSVSDDVMNTWAVVLDLRDNVNKVLESARVAKTLGAPMEANVKVFARNEIDASALRRLHGSTNQVDGLERALIVSNVGVVESEEEVRRCAHHNGGDEEECSRFVVGIDRCALPKCERCWHFDKTVGQQTEHPTLCCRCTDALTTMGIVTARVQGAAAA